MDMQFLVLKFLLLIPSLFIFWIAFVIHRLSQPPKPKLLIFTLLSIATIFTIIWVIFILVYGLEYLW